MGKECKICGEKINSPGKKSTCSDECKKEWEIQMKERKWNYNRSYKKKTAEHQKEYAHEYYLKHKATRVIKPASVERNRVRARERYWEKKAESEKVK